MSEGTEAGKIVGSRRQHIQQKLATVPVALTGLALGIAGLSGALSIVFGYAIAILGACIASILITLILIKNMLHYRVFLEELSHPILGSFIPTFAMALMVIASVILQFIPVLGKTLWLFAIGLHLIVLFQFVRYRLKEFNLQDLIPSWFVPPIGIVVACVTSAGMGFPTVTTILFCIGFVSYCIMLPIMLYRIMFGERLTDAQIPTFAIMGAPANLCLAGLLTAFPEPNMYLVDMLVGLGLFTTFLVYIFFIRIFQMPFSPSYTALTFPLAIGATAMMKYSEYLIKIGTDATTIALWKTIGYFELGVASCVILYTFIRIVVFLYGHFSLKTP